MSVGIENSFESVVAHAPVGVEKALAALAIVLVEINETLDRVDDLLR
ncbi:MAG: hypothetical protein RIC52_05550 [Amphiplicatus sp.]